MNEFCCNLAPCMKCTVVSHGPLPPVSTPSFPHPSVPPADTLPPPLAPPLPLFLYLILFILLLFLPPLPLHPTPHPLLTPLPTHLSLHAILPLFTFASFFFLPLPFCPPLWSSSTSYSD